MRFSIWTHDQCLLVVVFVIRKWKLLQPLQRLLARNFLSYCLLFHYIRVSSSVPFSFNFDYISSCEPDTRYLNLLIFVTFDQELHTYVYTRFHEHGAVGLRSKVLNNEFWNPFVARKFSSVCPIFHFWRYNQNSSRMFYVYGECTNVHI